MIYWSQCKSGMYMHWSIVEMARGYLKAIRAVRQEGPHNIMVYCFRVAVGNEI